MALREALNSKTAECEELDEAMRELELQVGSPRLKLCDGPTIPAALRLPGHRWRWHPHRRWRRHRSTLTKSPRGGRSSGMSSAASSRLSMPPLHTTSNVSR